MSRRVKRTSDERAALDRRGFLKAATLAGTGAVAQSVVSRANAGTDAQSMAPSASADAAVAERATTPSPQPHTIQITSREAEHGAPPSDVTTQSTCGSDFMVDVLRGLGIEYVAAIPG